ncbi:hypothetical protein Moror_14344 [Moniliophthora roreri MCA 2997]|uniref:Uncharacterized protein n=1 Tax=Moniliophthora roreri (strain MCA 2997) TaxID=1381753 RepID=V2XQ40_MONRO|nr:hypothetical protein Moror_14344 [Moniliophthora roreri MCA 2997]
MFLTSALTVGQLTFILRACIQVLSYGGTFFMGYIILASAPRIAPLRTHDTINRIVGRGTAMKEMSKWIINVFRGQNGMVAARPSLVLAMTLLSVYSILVALTDIGFLGFYTCNQPYTFLDRPASVNGPDSAQAMIRAALANGTDPSTIRSFRCDSLAATEELGDVSLGSNFTIRPCSSWRNSTFADPSTFAGINTTDSDMLLPRNLRPQTKRIGDFYLNTYRTSFGASLTLNTTIRNGIVVEPHETGLKVFFGVPSLRPHQSVTLEKTMALEVEVGCMSVGIFSSHDPDYTQSHGYDYFAETSDWRIYVGPDNLRDVLSRTTDRIREYYSPLFNTSSEDGYRIINATLFVQYTESPSISSFSFLLLNGSHFGDSFPGANIEIIRNCTEQLWTQLQLDEAMSEPGSGWSPPMCQSVMLTDMVSQEGTVWQRAARMVCAASAQVNMVSGTVSVSGEEQVSLNLTRLPSNLNQLRADFYNIIPEGTLPPSPLIPNGTIYEMYDPIIRYTLVDNPSGPTSHFIRSEDAFSNKHEGAGSAGNVLARVVPAMFDISELGTHSHLLDQLSLNEAGLRPKSATRWFGQTGASFILNSLVYNGWVAEASPAIVVSDTAGPIGTCYKSTYAVGFIPLFAAAFVIAFWMLFLLIAHGLSGVRRVGENYGGLKPNWNVICPNADALLIWESGPSPHLRLVSPGQAIIYDAASSTAAEHLNSRSEFMPEKDEATM